MSETTNHDCVNYAPGSKMTPSKCSHTLHGLILRKREINLLVLITKWKRVFIFGLYHYLVDLNQVGSKFARGVKNDLAPGVTCLANAYIGKTRQNLLV